MENLEEDNKYEEMSPSDRNTESSRLVASNTATKPSYLNVVSNLCVLLILGIIIYCCFKGRVSLFSFHPSLMTLGWMWFMTTAVNAITPGDLATEWMPIRLRSARHWVLQLFGGIIIIIGFIIIVTHKIILNKEHFSTLHAKFGLASLIFLVGTMLGGVGALYSLRLKSYLAPIYTKLLHASFGLTTFVLGVITIILGLFTKWWDFGDILRYTNLTLILLVMAFTILRPALKIFFRLKERLENVN